MGINNFLKNLFSVNKSEEQKKESEEINLGELKDWLVKKRKELTIKEKEVLELIIFQISLTLSELKENLNTLRKTNIDSKKVEEKIKIIVKENLKKYIEYTQNFIKDLENLKKEEITKFTEDANKIFADFDKKSYLSYQKTTFLVGKEIADIKKQIIDLSNYLKKILNENFIISNSFKTFSFIETKLNYLDANNEIKYEFGEKIRFLENKKENLEKNYEKIEKELDKIKKTKEYLGSLKKYDEIRFYEANLEREIYNLKNFIDFKALTNIFHTNKKEMELIKPYQENFKTAFQEKGLTEILNLLNKSGFYNEEKNKLISEKISYINQCKNKIKETSDSVKNNVSESLISKMAEMQTEIRNIDKEKENEIKKYEKLKTTGQELIFQIKQELEKINVFIRG